MNRARTIGQLGLLMLLAVAVAVVMRNDREVAERFDPTWVEGVARGWSPPFRAVIGPALRVGFDFGAGLVVMSAGLGLASLRRPFVPAGRNWPGRGVAAIAVSGLAVGFGAIQVASWAIEDPASTYFGLANPHFLSDSLRNGSGAVADMVLGAWMLLALAGRWRSEADNFERLGRVLGWCWLATFGFDLFRATFW